ncbi:MAG: fructosamine kinase family protein [Bacteroidota bacterium]
MKLFHGKNPVEEEVKVSLSEKFGKQVDIFSSGSLGGGCINHASKIETSEGAFFLKWNADCPSDIFIREAESLTELKMAAGNALVVPQVFAAREVDASPGFLVMEYLEPGYYLQNADEWLGRGLATVHSYQNDRFGFHNNNYCGSTLQDNSWKSNWAEFFRDNRLGFLLDLIRKERPLSAEEEKIYSHLLNKVSSLIPEDAMPVLVHGDLWSGNYMMSAGGPALIDPASYYADCEMEMGIMTMFGGFPERFYDAYNEVNPLRPDWKERNSLYQLYHVLNHYYLFGGSYRSQALQIAKRYS